MKEQIRNLEELLEASKECAGYFVGITLFDGQKLNHYFVSENFPQSDMLRSLARVKGLVVEDLERPFTPRSIKSVLDSNIKTNSAEIKPLNQDITPEDIIDGETTEDTK